MIRSDAINGEIIRLAREKKLPVFMLEFTRSGCAGTAVRPVDPDPVGTAAAE